MPRASRASTFHQAWTQWSVPGPERDDIDVLQRVPDDHPSKGHVFTPVEEGSRWCATCGHHDSVTSHRKVAILNSQEPPHNEPYHTDDEARGAGY